MLAWLFATTTMPSSPKKKGSSFSFSLLGRKASGYFHVRSVQVRVIPGTDPVEVIERAARDAIIERPDLTSATEINVTVYKVPEPFSPVQPSLTIAQPREPFGNDEADPVVQPGELEAIVNAGFLGKCSKLDSLSTLEDDALFKRYLIVVFEIQIQFLLFDAPSNSYFGPGEVTVGLDQTFEVVYEAAEKRVLSLCRGEISNKEFYHGKIDVMIGMVMQVFGLNFRPIVSDEPIATRVPSQRIRVTRSRSIRLSHEA